MSSVPLIGHQRLFMPLPAPRVSRRLGALLLVATLAALGGCAADPSLGPTETVPKPQELAAKYRLTGTTDEAAAHPSSRWWASFNDPELTRWIEKGFADSPDLRVAAARVAQAQAFLDSARAAQAPTLGFAADADSQRISDYGIFPPPLAGMVGTLKDVGLSGSLELDIFGRLAARTDAARLQALAGMDDREQARIRIAGAIAHAYFELARAQQTRRVLVELEQSREKMLDLVRQRVSGGFDTQVDRRLAEIPVPEIKVDIERASEQIELARHSLAVLAGQAPQAAADVEAKLPDGNVLAAPTALPMDLLARRADVAAAQARVQAALRGVEAARADFYPNVNLTALVGLDSVATQSLFKWGARVWQLEPAIHLPLFDGGMLRANLRGASAEADQAIDAYNSSVLQAASEVADALTSLAYVQRQREQQDAATKSAQAASDLADIRYEAGLGNLLAVLTAQASVLTQRRAEVDLQARSAALNVSLALALGGGYAPEGQAARE
jgi:NodT family efflux transporter outer membrane factor (OMF) lipoprotein